MASVAAPEPQRRHQFRLFGSVLFLAALLTASIPFAPSAGADESEPSVVDRGPIDQTGQWFTDGDGRVFITAGLNMVNMRAPYTPAAAGFDEHDAQFIADSGFDSVRLGIIWKALEPEPGVFNHGYLDSIEHTVELLTSRGVAVLFDGHQDMYNERFQGQGAPDWAVPDNGLSSLPHFGFPANQAFNIGLLAAYDAFWNNAPAPDGVGLQDHYAAMWGEVAKRFSGTPGILGYDIMNEPWPGSSFLLCYVTVGLSCGFADNGLDGKAGLNGMHERAAQAITQHDPGAIVHYEPFSMWNQGVPLRPKRPSSENAALSFHVYCTSTALFDNYFGCDISDGIAFANANRHAKRNGSATILSEFGATDNPKIVLGITNHARKNLTGFQYWSYRGWNDPTSHNAAAQGLVQDPKTPGPVSVSEKKRPKLEVLAAPHARAVAGTPLKTTWDHKKKVYSAAWNAERVDGNGLFPPGSITEIAVPQVNYPGGYEAKVVGGTVVSEPNSSRLLVRSDSADENEEITVTVQPR